jgi:hypothetical protein
MAKMAGLSLSGAEDADPLTQKTRPWSFFLVSSQYGVVHWFTSLLFFQFLF